MCLKENEMLRDQKYVWVCTENACGAYSRTRIERSQDIWPGWVQTTVQRAANTRVMTIIYPLGREERQNVKNSIMIWDPFKIRLQWLLGAGLAVFQISRGKSETVIRFKSMSFRLQVGVYKTSTVEVNGKWLS